ncbi:SH2 domain protein [Ancylostoma ceylanicum]|uniref:SH2 domain protein n=1 Tax=Ancylostoma ceylanicum TaxID=53326 RepID=A0A0D6MAN5_9BILA|nr:SH2 domain protein [Ancylostoma ceylanicum]
MSDYDCPTTSAHNLKEQSWYCGMVTRIKSEQMLRENGEFLVRDSISMPGDYVLTAMWNGKPLHFQINTAYVDGKKEFHGYCYERASVTNARHRSCDIESTEEKGGQLGRGEDWRRDPGSNVLSSPPNSGALEEESFGSVPALVNFYRSHRRPLTIASGCIISTPVDRTREGASVEGLELEASYMHVLRPHMNQSVAPEPVVVPPVPAALANRPLPLPIRSPRNTQDDEEDYSEMDYDAMDGILDASSTSINDRNRSSSVSSIPNVMSRQFQSCQNLSYRSQSPCSASKVPPPLPARPPLPPRPSFKTEMCTSIDRANCERSQPEDARDSAFLDYDEPRTKFQDDDYDKLPPSRSRSSEPDRNRLSGSSDCDSADSGVRDSRDSGIYSSPSPPDDHHASLSQVHLMQLKQFLLTKRPDEISLAISHEHAKMLRFLGSTENFESRANNGLRLVLLPSGALLRQELLERCSMLHYSCLLSILSGARKDAPLILKKWILTGVSLARHGDAFACACIAGALNESALRGLPWLWTSLDSPAKGEYEALRNLDGSLKKGEKLEHHHHTTVIPFLQPILEIMTGQESHYLDCTSYASEIDSLWAWLDRARDWCMRADESCKVANAKYGRADGGVMTPSFLSRLFVGGAAPEDRQKVLQGVIQRIMD